MPQGAFAIGADRVTRNRRPRRYRWLGPSLAGCALALSVVPTAGFALGAFEGAPATLRGERLGIFTPASVDPQLARFVAERSNGRLKRFTPAGVDSRATRTMTVAVRVDAEEARAIQVRSAIEAAQEKVAEGAAGINLAATRYNLGLARGYQTFAQATPRAIAASPLSDAAIPDLSEFRPSPGVARGESRFAARIAADEARVGTPIAGAGMGPGLAVVDGAPRIADSVAEKTVDLAGSYRLTRNLDVTAGVRYSQERARLAQLPDDPEDSQAVYIGTQFRF